MGDTFIPAHSVDHANGLPRLVFSMFVYLTDSDGNINVQDVRRFQSLLKDPSWTTSVDLRLGLSSLQRDYAQYWSQYDDRLLKIGHEMIAKAFIETIGVCASEQAAALREGLEKFLDRIHRAPYGLRLQQTGQRSRGRALDELRAIIAMKASAPAEAARAPGSADAIETANRDPSSSPALWPVASLTPGNGNVWAGVKTRVRCVSVVHETHDCKTYTFMAVPHTLFHYKPGQFVTLELPIEGRIVRRSYTISSSPSRPYSLSITVKRVPSGQVSNWLYENMVEEFEFDIAGPSGKFTCFSHQAEKILLIAAGSGITPTMSMLRWLADTSTKVDVVFINNVRTPQDIIFRQELNHLSVVLGERLRLGIVPAAAPSGQIWHGYRGHFGEQLLRGLAPDFMEREVFVCGPPGYMEAVKTMLAALDFPMDRFHSESFGGAPVRKAVMTVAPPLPSSVLVDPGASTVRAAPVLAVIAPAAIPEATSAAERQMWPAETLKSAPCAAISIEGASTVSIEKSDVSFKVPLGLTILDGAEACGVELEHSCRSGVCGTCRMRRVSGEIEMGEQSHLSDQDLDDGYILTCVSHAKGPVMLAKEA